MGRTRDAGPGTRDQKRAGIPVFVSHVLPGETVRVKITRRHKQFFEAELLEILEPAATRVEPPCPYFGKCGGCQWQHIAYQTQLEWKQKILEETLIRIGKIANPNVLPTIASPKEFGWRSRVTVHADEKGQVGFFAGGTKDVVDIEKCLIVEDGINEELKKRRDHGRWTMDDGQKNKDFELRSTKEKGFTQVNPLQNENLKKIVRAWAEKLPHDSIVELFCGSGNFTEALMPIAKKIIAVDADQDAIDLASLRLKHLQTYALTHFICSDAIRFFARSKFETPIDLVVLDPPRDGAAGVVEGVLKHKPKNIIYISCNPATLARDLKFLNDFAGYGLVQSQPVDMFPMSYHIESVSLITPCFRFQS